MKLVNIIVSFFIGCIIYTTEGSKPPLDNIEKIYSALQGYWVVSDNKKDLIRIEKDTIEYFYENKSYQKSQFRISTKALINSDTMYSSKGEYIFQVFDGEIITTYYLTGYSSNEFSLMTHSNGQPIVYKKKKKSVKHSTP